MAYVPTEGSRKREYSPDTETTLVGESSDVGSGLASQDEEEEDRNRDNTLLRVPPAPERSPKRRYLGSDSPEGTLVEGEEGDGGSQQGDVGPQTATYHYHPDSITEEQMLAWLKARYWELWEEQLQLLQRLEEIQEEFRVQRLLALSRVLSRRLLASSQQPSSGLSEPMAPSSSGPVASNSSEQHDSAVSETMASTSSEQRYSAVSETMTSPSSGPMASTSSQQHHPALSAAMASYSPEPMPLDSPESTRFNSPEPTPSEDSRERTPSVSPKLEQLDSPGRMQVDSPEPARWASEPEYSDSESEAERWNSPDRTPSASPEHDPMEDESSVGEPSGDELSDDEMLGDELSDDEMSDGEPSDSEPSDSEPSDDDLSNYFSGDPSDSEPSDDDVSDYYSDDLDGDSSVGDYSDDASSEASDEDMGLSREEKNSQYEDPDYEADLCAGGSCMWEHPLGISASSRRLCEDLLTIEQNYPRNSLFADDQFELTLQAVEDGCEERVLSVITPHMAPSPEALVATGYNDLLLCLIEAKNKGWDNSLTLTDTTVQPDFSVGFRRESFTSAEWAKLRPFLTLFFDRRLSLYQNRRRMYFPFFTCEVACGPDGLEIADRQNAHSMALGARSIVEMFRLAGLERELSREILTWSVSHDERNVRIHGCYPVFARDGRVHYHRHLLRAFSFTSDGGAERWAAYRFVKNLYDRWMPDHLERLRWGMRRLVTPEELGMHRPEVREALRLWLRARVTQMLAEEAEEAAQAGQAYQLEQADLEAIFDALGLGADAAAANAEQAEQAEPLEQADLDLILRVFGLDPIAANAEQAGPPPGAGASN